MQSIKFFHSWFGRYTKRFLLKASVQDKKALGLKIVHSQRVWRLVRDLSKKLNLQEKVCFLAQIAGLFHDIGRFEQFEKYHTFFDMKSEDHAALSVKVLKDEDVLDCLDSKDKDLVLEAIYVHNKFSIPKDFKGDKLIVAKLLRDADKIDIWRVFNEFYTKGIGSEDINLGLPLGEDISDRVYKDFLNGKIVNIKDVKSQMDFMVMRLSWLYDINFPESLHQIIEIGYVDTIFKYLPKTEKSQRIKRKLISFIKEFEKKEN